MCVCVFIACCFCCLSPPSPWKSQQERKRRTFIVMTEVYRKLLVPSSCSIQSVLYVSECEGGFKWSISSRLPPSERTTKRMVVRSFVEKCRIHHSLRQKKQLRKTSSLRGLWRFFRPLSHRITTGRQADKSKNPTAITTENGYGRK